MKTKKEKTKPTQHELNTPDNQLNNCLKCHVTKGDVSSLRANDRNAREEKEKSKQHNERSDNYGADVHEKLDTISRLELEIQ